MAGLLGLGIGQAFVGWWMVRSGFSDPKEHMPGSNNENPRVSAYRLTTHLAAALTIYGGLVWTGLQCLSGGAGAVTGGLCAANSAHRTLRALLRVATGVVTATVLSGGFVAGNDAGEAFNTWPRMDEDWVPEEVVEVYSGLPKQANLLAEDTATVQFNHRMLAYSSVLSALSAAGYALSKGPGVIHPRVHWLATRAVPVAVLGQLTLGIFTVLNAVPVSLGVLHQGGGVALLTVLLTALSRLR